jgi:ATP synthase protein I
MVRAASGRRKGCGQRRNRADVESMADDARENGDRKRTPADEVALSARFKRLDERLGHFDRGRSSDSQQGERPASDPSAIARGFRLSTELVAGVLVGAGIGWLLDWWLGTSPWGMIVFLLLGFAAGVLNVIRAAGIAPGQRPGAPSSK